MYIQSNEQFRISTASAAQHRFSIEAITAQIMQTTLQASIIATVKSACKEMTNKFEAIYDKGE
jgi:hypothetical protein